MPDLFLFLSCLRLPCRVLLLALQAGSIACCKGRPQVIVTTKPPASRQTRARHTLRRVGPSNHLCSHVSRRPCSSRRPCPFRIQAKSGFSARVIGRSNQTSETQLPIPRIDPCLYRQLLVAEALGKRAWQSQGVAEYTRKAMDDLGHWAQIHGSRHAFPRKLEIHHWLHLPT